MATHMTLTHGCLGSNPNGANNKILIKKLEIVSFIMVIIMKNKEELYYCFRYHCSFCPKAKECEERNDLDESKSNNKISRLRIEKNNGCGRRNGNNKRESRTFN